MKLFYIKWCDATSKFESWMTLDESIEWADNENWTVDIVGWVLKETKEYILIASKKGQDPADGDEWVTQYGQVFKIPKTWIRERQEIKLKPYEK